MDLSTCVEIRNATITQTGIVTSYVPAKLPVMAPAQAITINSKTSNGNVTKNQTTFSWRLSGEDAEATPHPTIMLMRSNNGDHVLGHHPIASKANSHVGEKKQIAQATVEIVSRRLFEYIAIAVNKL
jgi:hypothetical protein